MTISQIKENLQYASWEKTEQTDGERRYQQWTKLKGISKQLQYFYKNRYGRGDQKENIKKFNCIAGNSDGEVSSEVSLDEMCYDDQSSNNTGIIESAASAEEISPSSGKPAQNFNQNN